MAANQPIYTHNNQPKTGGRDGGDYGGEARRVGGARKCNIIIFGGAKVKVERKKLKLIFEFSK